jgi:hypothetical protein
MPATVQVSLRYRKPSHAKLRNRNLMLFAAPERVKGFPPATDYPYSCRRGRVRARR